MPTKIGIVPYATPHRRYSRSSQRNLLHAYYAKQCGDSRFFAAKEASLSAEGGDSPREQEKSRISVIKDTQKF